MRNILDAFAIFADLYRIATWAMRSSKDDSGRNPKRFRTISPESQLEPQTNWALDRYISNWINYFKKLIF